RITCTSYPSRTEKPGASSTGPWRSSSAATSRSSAGSAIPRSSAEGPPRRSPAYLVRESSDRPRLGPRRRRPPSRLRCERTAEAVRPDRGRRHRHRLLALRLRSLPDASLVAGNPDLLHGNDRGEFPRREATAAPSTAADTAP